MLEQEMEADSVAKSSRLTWVEALEGVECRRGRQLEGQRGQRVLLTKDVRLALADGQDLGVLVQGNVRVDRQGRDRLWLLGLATLRLLLLLEALRLCLACSATSSLKGSARHHRSRDDMNALHLASSHLLSRQLCSSEHTYTYNVHTLCILITLAIALGQCAWPRMTAEGQLLLRRRRHPACFGLV